MIIRVNGEPYEIAGPMSISALLARLDVDPQRVAIEHNLTVVKRDRYDTVVVHAGDEIEIVNFVGGGQRVSPCRRAASWPLGIANPDYS